MYRTAILALAAALAIPAAATAAPFTLMIYETGSELAKRTDKGSDGQAYWSGYGAFAAAATEAKVLRGGSAVWAGENAVVVSASGGDVHDAGDEMKLGGYFQIDVATLAEAVEWARKLPASESGRIEVRAGYPAPGM